MTTYVYFEHNAFSHSKPTVLIERKHSSREPNVVSRFVVCVGMSMIFFLMLFVSLLIFQSSPTLVNQFHSSTVFLSFSHPTKTARMWDGNTRHYGEITSPLPTTHPQATQKLQSSFNQPREDGTRKRISGCEKIMFFEFYPPKWTPSVKNFSPSTAKHRLLHFSPFCTHFCNASHAQNRSYRIGEFSTNASFHPQSSTHCFRCPSFNHTIHTHEMSSFSFCTAAKRRKITFCPDFS